MDTPPGAQPFNYFAGAWPTSSRVLSSVAGFYFVITNVTLSMAATATPNEFLIYDGEGNRRLQAALDGSGESYPQLLPLQVNFVLGNDTEAVCVSTGGEGYASIDGYAFPPQDSPIW
jgi:hypothetical protein